jgi:ketosteroid isomerase-like protein
MKMLDEAIVEMLQRHWEDGWNRGDVEMILAPFAADVVFSSPGIAMLTGDPAKTTIEGKDAVRLYIEDAVRRASQVRYRLDATYVGTDSIVIVYSCGLADGEQKVGSDSMRVGEDRLVVEWRCHY